MNVDLRIWLTFAAALVWLLIYWTGSLALEATGLERRKARFQVLSTMTGTGYTTREAESVMNHPQRRRIVFWLILLGNTSILAFVILLILAVGRGVRQPSGAFVILVVSLAAFLLLAAWFGIIDRLGKIMLKRLTVGRGKGLYRQEILVRVGGYGVVEITVSEKDSMQSVRDTQLAQVGITVLALERRRDVVSFPGPEEPLRPGDRLLCFGELDRLRGEPGRDADSG